MSPGGQEVAGKTPVQHPVQAILLMLYAIGECFRELQLADAYTLFFAAPLVITLLSGPVLGEPAGPIRIAAAVVGFVAVLVESRRSRRSIA